TTLIPDTLKSAYGKAQTWTRQLSCLTTFIQQATFTSHGRYKRKAYRASQFAPHFLADNGLQVVMKLSSSLGLLP
ncbi:hypothetical protein LXA43DRAFT_907209, partial [Ganoderma leucocontextum]